MQYETTTVVSNAQLAPGHYLLTLQAGSSLPEIRAGQFLTLRCDPHDQHSLLRPFSILDADETSGILSVYYKCLGRLSSRLSRITSGEHLDVVFPLGKGFPWLGDWRRVGLIGGGVGIAPLLFLARQLEPYGTTMQLTGYFGGASADDLVPELLTGYDFPMQLATMDGSVGYKGSAVECFMQSDEQFDVIYTCGPNPMLAALQEVAPAGLPAYASLEEYMACGVGACYGCTAKILTEGVEKNLTVCKDGPVFELGSVVFPPIVL